MAIFMHFQLEIKGWLKLGICVLTLATLTFLKNKPLPFVADWENVFYFKYNLLPGF